MAQGQLGLYGPCPAVIRPAALRVKARVYDLGPDARRGPRSINVDDSGSEEERAAGGPGPGSRRPLIHLPCLPRPLADDPQARARYDAKALLASMNSTSKAAILTGLNDRISRAMRYRRVYVKITREIRAHKRLQRRSIIARLRAAVQLNEITGSVKALTGFRRMEKQNSGEVSGTCSVLESREGTKIIWEACTTDLDIYATRDGHAVSLRKTVEVEMLRYLQTAASKAPRIDSEGQAYTKTPATFETRTTSKRDDPGADKDSDPCPYPELWQDRFSIKFTWDARNISKKLCQTEGMLLIIPRGPEGKLYCQSALRIRTIIVYTGKDSREMAQVNLKKCLEEIEELRVHGLRYSAKMDTFLNQVSSNGTKAPLTSGDRDMHVDMVLPADMAAHVGLLGHGGVRDSKKQFCTNCTCCLSERHTPLCLVKVEEDTTVGALAAAHDMHPDLFLAMNTGRDPAGMFPGQELTERILSYKTVPLPRGRGPPPAVPAAATLVVDTTAAAAAPTSQMQAPVRGAASRNEFDQRFGRQKKRQRGPVRAPAPATSPPAAPGPAGGAEEAEPNDESKLVMDWNSVIGEDESCLLGDARANVTTVVRGGTIVRAVSTFKVDRPSQFLNGILNLDPHR